jgi:hypothetical protein
MIARLFVIIVCMALAGTADAQLLNGVSRASTGGGAGTIIPSCSNSLDFTQACNSQYIGAIL